MSRGTIIFDFDGTLADSFEFASSFIATQAGKATLSPAERKQQFSGLTMRGMAEKLGIPPWRALWLFFYGRRVMTRRVGEIKLFAEIDTVLRTLHEQGYALFVLSSNRNKNVQLVLQRYGLVQYFSATQGSASVLGKPLALRILLRRHGLSAADCTYVGDEVGDLDAARRLHIHTVAASWGYNDVAVLAAKKPFAIARTPVDLIKIFDSKHV